VLTSHLMRKDEIDGWVFLMTEDGSDFGVILFEFWKWKLVCYRTSLISCEYRLKTDRSNFGLSILTFKLNDNFNKSRLGVITVDPIASESNVLTLD
jgi:hypothetical protein